MISVLSKTLVKVLIEKNENQRLNDSQISQGFKDYLVSPICSIVGKMGARETGDFRDTNLVE